MKTLQKISARAWVQHVDDERELDNGIIVTLCPGWEFQSDPGCGVRGFDTVAEALQETARSNVNQKTK